MEEKQIREEFDTGLAKIRHEIKSLLVPHGQEIEACRLRVGGVVLLGIISGVDELSK
jgi:hypothetical protein